MITETQPGAKISVVTMSRNGIHIFSDRSILALWPFQRRKSYDKAICTYEYLSSRF